MMEEINEALDNVARRVRALQWTCQQSLSPETISEMSKETVETCERWLNTPEMKAFMSTLISVNIGLKITEDGKIKNHFYLVNKIHINVLADKLRLDCVSCDNFKPFGVITLKLEDVRNFARWRSTWQINK